jgi:hypothetical protein
MQLPRDDVDHEPLPITSTLRRYDATLGSPDLLINLISLDLDLQATSQSDTRGRPGICDVDPQHESCHLHVPVTGPPGLVGHLHRQRGHLPQ